MDMFQKREKRSKNKLEDNSNTENTNKTNINWFPGHMTKAKREIEQKLKQVDMIIELRDARAVASSKNPLIYQLAQHKPKVIILSKKDMADPIQTALWQKALTAEETVVLAIDTIKDNYKQAVIKACETAMATKHQRQIARGIKPRGIRAMVVGIPNVGKSTFINTMRQKKVVKTANTPGVTRTVTLIKVNQSLELMDTPGMLWPKFENDTYAYHLALIGSMNDHILPLETLTTYAIEFLTSFYPNRLTQYFNDKQTYSTLIQDIGVRKGYFLGAGKIDEKRCLIDFLKTIRMPEMGISWDRYDESI